MQLGWGLLTMVILAAAVLWFWQDSLAARESANAAAMEACGRLGLQFLDGTVAFARVALVREAGWLKLRRTYVFDYTARSIERLQGFVVLAGDRIETVGFAHASDEEIAAQRADTQGELPQPERASAHDGSNVLDLDAWRRQHQHRAPAQPPRRTDSGDGRG